MYEVQSPPKRENVMLASALTILSVLFTLTHVYHKVPLIFFVSIYIYMYLIIFLISGSLLRKKIQYSDATIDCAEMVKFETRKIMYATVSCTMNKNILGSKGAI